MVLCGGLLTANGEYLCLSVTISNVQVVTIRMLRNRLTVHFDSSRHFALDLVTFITLVLVSTTD